jgi:predicted phage terminase large subunit-like protein
MDTRAVPCWVDKFIGRYYRSGMSGALHTIPDQDLREMLLLEEQLKKLETREAAQTNFMAYVDHVYDGFIVGRHHKIIAEKLERIASGDLKRLIVNMPPRHSKSEFASYLMPSWFLGRNPKLKIIQATMNTELAVRFGRKVRDLIADPIYHEIFPDTDLKQDSQAAGRWETSAGGEYFAAGVGAAMTGRGADLLIIDDPHSEQDALSTSAYDNTYEWYTSGPRQRLQPGGAIIIVQTRWSKKDLTGRLLQAQGNDMMSDQWEVVEFPAIMPSGEPLWPEFWKKEELLKVKAALSLGKWNAQWQQNPVSEETAVIKREWWNEWEEEDIPQLQYVIQSYDTAYSKKETADYSAITTWGVFEPHGNGEQHLILMDAKRGRWNFPELKQIAREENEYWEPDMMLIEAKATGTPLADEMRLLNLPVITFAPGRKKGGGGLDKTTRMHMASPIFESGKVWYPAGQKFAEEVIEEVASFPNGDHDDFCDSMTMALMRFRQGGFISLQGEELEDWLPSKKREYY